jgi:predicted phage terminase large subunit-like protein
VRFWDLAATVPKHGTDPDWTAGVKMARTPEGKFVVVDVVRTRDTPGTVKALILQTAHCDGVACKIRMEQEPGASGVNVIADYAKTLAGFAFRGVKHTGDKILRMEPLSSQAEAGNVQVVAGPWLEAFLAEAEYIPNGAHDDQDV